MYVRVVTSSRSRGIGNGLTYRTDKPLEPGTLVTVPLRKQLVEGIVIREEKPEHADADFKDIAKVMSDGPLLPPELVKAAVWMAEYYVCTLRHALQVFLPTAPWINLLPEPVHVYRLTKNDAVVRGKKQLLIVDFLKIHPDSEESVVKTETGASAATITSLEKAGIITRTTTFAGPSPLIKTDAALALPSLSATESAAEDALHEDRRPGVLFDEVGTDRSLLYAKLIQAERSAGRSCILLFPQVYDARKAFEKLNPLLGGDGILVHSHLTTAQRRAAFRTIRRSAAPVIVGTRTALFSPVQKPGLLLIDDEHEWVYKSEQTPRYHTRLTAEVIAKLHDAKLVLSSSTPSLESWRHAHTPAASPRYHLAKIRPDVVATLPTISCIDLADVDFGSLYPFSPPLVSAIESRLNRNERSVLLLNRRGSATALLCMDCRATVQSPVTKLPLTVHVINNKPLLIDHLTGHSEGMPPACPNCKSVNLKPVGAGTQKIETLLQRMFPTAKILRADADTLDTPGAMEDMINALSQNRADILVGTQPVLRAVPLPNVTLAGVLIADVGLSQPNFRAGERVFQQLTHMITRMTGKQNADIILQTFRPNAPEIDLAVRRDTQRYLETELNLRNDTGYPPAAQMICLLVRGPKASSDATKLYAEAKKLASQTGCTVSLGPPQPGRPPVWRITLRGQSPRMLVHGLRLDGVVVDVDPLELD